MLLFPLRRTLFVVEIGVQLVLNTSQLFQIGINGIQLLTLGCIFLGQSVKLLLP